jgi:hypothetical protein
VFFPREEGLIVVFALSFVVCLDMTDARRKVAGRLLQTYDSAIACGDFRHGFSYTEHLLGALGEQKW